MTDSAWHRHPIVVRTLGGVLTAIILGGGAQLLGLIDIKVVSANVWQWLSSAGAVPNWLLVAVISVLVAVVVRFRRQHRSAALHATTTAAERVPPIPNELYIFGMVWRWHWRTDGLPGPAQPFCPECDMQLVPTMNRQFVHGMYGAIVYTCDECQQVRHHAELPRDYLPLGPDAKHRALQQQVTLAAQRDMRNAHKQTSSR